MFTRSGEPSKQEKLRFIAAILKSDEAEGALKAGDMAAGMALYREAIEICPPCELRGDYQVILGAQYFQLGEAGLAEQQFRAALAEGCSYPYEALRRLAFASAAQGDFEAAVSAMHRAAKVGEDLAFASQAIVAFGLALGRLEEARSVSSDGPELADCQPEYLRRLALAEAELALLADDRDGLQAALDSAMAFQSELGGDEALRVAVLDQIAGRAAPRPAILAALSGDSSDWAAIAWEVLGNRASPCQLMASLEPECWGVRAENLSLYHRLAGLLAEQGGDQAAARRHYETARIEPFTQWCIDFHLAGLGLARLATQEPVCAPEKLMTP